MLYRRCRGRHEQSSESGWQRASLPYRTHFTPERSTTWTIPRDQGVLLLIRLPAIFLCAGSRECAISSRQVFISYVEPARKTYTDTLQLHT